MASGIASQNNQEWKIGYIQEKKEERKTNKF